MKFTYPRMSSATTVHDQSVRFVGTDFEGYTTGFGRPPRWQHLKHRRCTPFNIFPLLGRHFQKT